MAEPRANAIIEDAAERLADDYEALERIVDARKAGGDLTAAVLSLLAQRAPDAQEATTEQEAQETTGAERLAYSLEEYRAALEAPGAEQAFYNAFNAKQKAATEKVVAEITIEPGKEGLKVGEALLTGALPAEGLKLGDSLLASALPKGALTLNLPLVQQVISAFIDSETYRQIKETILSVSEFFDAHKEEFAHLAQEKQRLYQFLQAEIDAHNAAHPDAEPLDILDVLEYMEMDGEPATTDPNGQPLDNPYTDLINRARAARAAFDEAAETIEFVDKAAEELPRIISHPTDDVIFPVEKVNSNVWDMITGAETNGQLKIRTSPANPAKGKDAGAVIYGIDFNELDPGVKITKQLTHYDKRCYIATAALFNAGNSTISATQIYKMMGNRGQPKAKDIKKINDSLTKMGAARVYIDNAPEIKAKLNYPVFKYDASLLPFERLSAYINNTLCEQAIHLFREPPLITFARERGQVQPITRQLLESPVRKTDANLRLDDYLIERISHMKNKRSKAPRKMLYSTIYEKCGITSRSQRSRAPEKIRRYLDHYKQCSFISGYIEGKDGITIQLPE